VLPELRGLDGYAGALLLQRAAPEGVEVLVITWWRSLAAIRGFAGADLERAVVADEARAVLTQFDRRVRHFEVVVDDTLQDHSHQP
jgi:heme-degrading monooxygenase HmoA